MLGKGCSFPGDIKGSGSSLSGDIWGSVFSATGEVGGSGRSFLGDDIGCSFGRGGNSFLTLLFVVQLSAMSIAASDSVVADNG